MIGNVKMHDHYVVETSIRNLTIVTDLHHQLGSRLAQLFEERNGRCYQERHVINVVL